MAEVRWSGTAVEQINEIAEFIAQDSPISADRWVDRVFAHQEQLQEQPLSGRVVPEVADEKIRELIIGNYRLIYRSSTESVDVLSVQHSRKLLLPSDI